MYVNNYCISDMCIVLYIFYIYKLHVYLQSHTLLLVPEIWKVGIHLVQVFVPSLAMLHSMQLAGQARNIQVIFTTPLLDRSTLL